MIHQEKKLSRLIQILEDEGVDLFKWIGWKTRAHTSLLIAVSATVI